MHKQRERLIVSVQTRKELDMALDRAVDMSRTTAAGQGVGISVTLLAAGRYEAALDPLVPAGYLQGKLGLSNRPQLFGHCEC